MKKDLTRDYYSLKATKYGIRTARLNQSMHILQTFTNVKILDIGCATGYLGKLLKHRNNYVVGVDISEAAVRQAKKVLDHAYALDIETEMLPKSMTFDLIIMTEVIEHLFQPKDSLKKLLRHLKPNGRVFLSTPNFLYWGNRLQFLLGHFSYSAQGVFDESHIHFFTYTTIRKLLEDLGLNIVEENHIVGGRIGRFLAVFFPGAFASHFILLARKRGSLID